MALGNVFDLQMGKTPSRDVLEYWNNGDNDWVSIKDLSGYGRYVGSTKETISDLGVRESNIKTVPAGTLIMSFKLSIGKTAITTREVFTNEAIMAFLNRGLQEIDLNYMWHQFRTRDWSSGSNTAVMGKTLNKKTLGASLICVPEIDEQRRVASLLDCVVRQLENAEGRLAALHQLVKSRFIEMFGDPVENPMRWDSFRLDEFCEIITGNTPSRKCADYYGAGIEWVKSDNINGNGGISAAAETLSEKGREEARIAPEGSILMVCIAGSVKSIGKVGLLDREAAFNQQINALVPNAQADAIFLLKMLELAKDYLCDGVNMQLKGILNKSALSAKRFSLPPLSLQREFADFVRRVDKLEFVDCFSAASAIMFPTER